jgi:hypothetical protein
MRPSIVGWPPDDPGPGWGIEIAAVLQRVWAALRETRRAQADPVLASHEAALAELRRLLACPPWSRRASWEEAPLIAGVLVGVRCWDVTGDGELRSPLWSPSSERWPAFERQVARCALTEHDALWSHDAAAPAVDCCCGIYALNRVDPYLRTSLARGRVVGTVSLWGQVIRASHGYRAQYAYPRLLVVPGAPWKAAAVAARYGVPALPVGDPTDSAIEAFLQPDLAAVAASMPGAKRPSLPR